MSITKKTRVLRLFCILVEVLNLLIVSTLQDCWIYLCLQSFNIALCYLNTRCFSNVQKYNFANLGENWDQLVSREWFKYPKYYNSKKNSYFRQEVELFDCALEIQYLHEIHAMNFTYMHKHTHTAIKGTKKSNIESFVFYKISFVLRTMLFPLVDLTLFITCMAMHLWIHNIFKHVFYLLYIYVYV